MGFSLRRTISISFILIWTTYISAQVSWWNPAQTNQQFIEGVAWPSESASPYDRLPARAQADVREPVWNLSHHTAGLSIRFRSNASSIIVRYQVDGNLEMPHMPATGVSGLDLYAIDSDGNWNWCRGSRQFKDTIVYRFSGMTANDRYHEQGREYRLYLPLYNHVTWLEIGVDPEDYFEPLPVRPELPIVVYGTSIAQGGVASRPGMGWTNILARKMDHPLINLAFSGNGRLEPEIIELLTEIKAKIYLIDCLPNLTDSTTYPDDELTRRILHAIHRLKEVHPETPILLVDHDGYTDGSLDHRRLHAYERVNRIQLQAYQALKAEGISGLYYLTKDQIGIDMDDMVDGTHPSDLGMKHYAEGYEKALRTILHEPVGSVSTTQPCTQRREPGNYDWEMRHREILAMNAATPPKMVILANSIVHFWGGEPKAPIVREEASWSNNFTPMGLRNLAYGWDRIENVLWRVYHGELDGFAAGKVIVMIGTNNLHLNTDDEILTGLSLLLDAIRYRQPEAEILLMGLLPRRDYEARIVNLNLQIARLAGDQDIRFGDVGSVFLQPDHKIDESLFSDGLHPNADGYKRFGSALLPLIKP